jgi:hypothetical protein
LRKEDLLIASDEFMTRYQQLVDSLNYLAVRTRPDLSYAFGVVSRFMSNPTLEHLKAVHRIYAYLNATPDFGLVYTATTANNEVVGWADSDYAGCPDTRRSTTGWVSTMNGSPVN